MAQVTWLIGLSIAFAIVNCVCYAVLGDDTSAVPVPGNRCGQGFLRVDAAHIYSSKNDTTPSCEIQLKSPDSFVVLYTHISLECGQTLEIYKDLDQIQNSSAVRVLDCYTQHSELDPDYFSTKYIRLVFENPESRSNFSFDLTVTAYIPGQSFQEKPCEVYDRRSCGDVDGHGVVCLDEDLFCDGVKNCPDGRDEASCFEEESVLGQIVSGIVSLAVFVGVCAGIIYCCSRSVRGNSVFRRARMNTGNQTVVIQMAQPQPAPSAAPPPYYPVGTVPPPVMYPAPGTVPPPGLAQAPPPGSYPTQTTMMAAPAYDYHSVPTAPPPK